MSAMVTERTEAVFDFLVEYLDEHGYPPSVREIGQRIGVRSTSLVLFYLERLEAEGRIERVTGRARAVRILGPA